MKSIRRYYIQTEIEACKREEIRKVIRKSLARISFLYILCAIVYFAFGFISLAGYGNPSLTETETAICSSVLITAGISMTLMLILVVDCIYGIWTEPTDKEKEEYGDRIV